MEDYVFKLHSRVYYGVRETVNRIAASGGGDRGNASRPTRSSRPPAVPRHRRGSDFALSPTDPVYNDIPSIMSIGQQRSVSIPDLSASTLDFIPEKGGSPSSKKRMSNPVPPSLKVTNHKFEAHQLHSQSMKESPTHEILRKSDSDPRSQSMKDNRIPKVLSDVLTRIPNTLSEGINGKTDILSEESTETPNILSEGSTYNPSDYQKPRPAVDAIYNIPIPADDPRNDYQVPRPIEETYMVPRPVTELDPSSHHGVMKIPKGGKHSVSPLLSRKVTNGLEHSYEDPDNYGGNR